MGRAKYPTPSKDIKAKDIAEELEEEVRGEKWRILRRTPDYHEVALQLPLILLERCEKLSDPIQQDKRGGSISHVLKITPEVVARLAITNGLAMLEAEYLESGASDQGKGKRSK